MAQVEKRTGIAITALVLSIIGIFSYGILSIPGVILGHIAKSKINQQPDIYGGTGMATASLILGYIVIGTAALFLGGATALFSAL